MAILHGNHIYEIRYKRVGGTVRHHIATDTVEEMLHYVQELSNDLMVEVNVVNLGAMQNVRTTTPTV